MLKSKNDNERRRIDAVFTERSTKEAQAHPCSPHLLQDWARPCPHLHRGSACPRLWRRCARPSTVQTTPETRLVRQHVQTRETENQIVELKRTAEKKLNELAPEKRQRHL